MPRLLTLTASAAAASDRLAETLEDGAASAADQFQGLYAFALRSARPAQPLARSVLGAFAQAAAARAKLALAPRDCLAFAGVLSELHGSGASPEDVAAAGAAAGLEGPGRQLARAFAAHRELLAACGRIDPGALGAIAGLAIAEGKARFEFDQVRVEPRATWTQDELSLLAALGGAGVPVSVALPFDPRRPDLFAPLEKVHQELHRGGVESANVDPAEGATPELCKRLLCLFEVGAVTPGAHPSPVLSYTLPTAEAEARELALRVRSLLREGCPPDEIAVAGSPEVLAAAARALRAGGIATSRPPARSLAATLPGRAALALLELAEGGIEREPLCRLLEAGLWPLGGPPGQRRRGARLAELLREAGSLDHATGKLLPALWARIERTPSEAKDERPELARELERGLALVQALPLQGRAGEHATALWATLRQLGMAQALAASPADSRMDAGPERSRGLVAAAETALALEKLGELLGELAALRSFPELRGRAWPSLSRGEFAGLLAGALESEPAPAGRETASGVLLCEPTALVGRHFDHVFLPGLLDGEAEREGDVLLPAALRDAICQRLERPAALRPSGRAAQRRQERLGLYLACCSARRTLSASAPRMDAGGSPIEPAALLRELARVAGSEEPDRLDRPLLPAGELCLTRAEAAAAHSQDPALRTAEPLRTTRLDRLEERERLRREAIVAHRADPTSGALATGSRASELLPLLLTRLEKRSLSPSLLEDLARCGFRTLCDRIFKLGPPEERGEELAANEGGTVRHRALHDGFEALRREGLLPLRGGDRRRQELQTFLGGARAALDAYEREQPVGHPVVWAAERRTVERQLVRIYGRELGDAGGWEPAYFELEFQSEVDPSPFPLPFQGRGGSERIPLSPGGGEGQREGEPQLSLFAQPAQPTTSPRRAPLRLELVSGPALLGGKIDRVDRRPGGLRVIDYKTGGLDSRQRLLADGFGETELQLAVYALLVHEALGPGSSVDAAYVSISEARISPTTVAAMCAKQGIDLNLFLATDDASRARCRAEERPNLVERIAELLGRARAGDFAVTPGNCRYCDHVSACRVGPYYEEQD